MDKLRFALPVLVAVALGPLVAGLAFCGLMVASTLADLETAVSLGDHLTMFVIYIAFAYFEGGVIALLAGILLAIWMVWRPPSMLAANASALGSVTAFRLAAAAGLLSPAGASLVRNNFVLTLALAALSASVCWLLTYRFVKTV